MTEERKAELREQAAVMLAAADGKEIEILGDDEWVQCEPLFNWVTFKYRVKKVPTVKYIPFTAETFKPHRERWVKCGSGAVRRVTSYADGLRVGADYLSWHDFLDHCAFDDTGEPCGQRIEE